MRLFLFRRVYMGKNIKIFPSFKQIKAEILAHVDGAQLTRDVVNIMGLKLAV